MRYVEQGNHLPPQAQETVPERKSDLKVHVPAGGRAGSNPCLLVVLHTVLGDSGGSPLGSKAWSGGGGTEKGRAEVQHT